MIATEQGKPAAAEASEPGKDASELDGASADSASAGGPAPPLGLILPPPPAALQTGAQTPPPAGGAAPQAVAGQTALAAKAEGADAAGGGAAAEANAVEPGKPASERGFEAFLGASGNAGSLALPADLSASAAAAPGAALSASAPAGAAGAATQPAPPTPLGAVPITIGLRALSGSSQFEIRLDPKDLGRIDVTLDIDKDRGTVTAHLVVDRPETLALLQRDAGNLQQTLSQAGLDPTEGGINMSLRGEGAGGQSADRRASGGRDPSQRGDASSLDADPRLSLDGAPLRALRGPGGVDIRI